MFTGRHVIHTQKYVEIICNEMVKLGYYTKEELTDTTPRLLEFLVPKIGSYGYPKRSIDKNENEYNEELVGKTIDILFEEREGKYFKGHSTNYVLVKVETKEDLENQILPVEILETKNLETIGKI